MNFIKSIIAAAISKLPAKNIIIFESLPDFSDNTLAVFKEFINRGLNNNYKLVWTTHGAGELPEEMRSLKNVIAVNMDSAAYKYYYSFFAKGLVVSNYFMQKRRKEQYYIYLAHGAAFKGIKDKRYVVPEDCYGCDFCAYSEYLGKYDVNNLHTDIYDVSIIETGYARNDILFTENEKCSKLFDTEKYIYWLPTFRQKKDDKTSVSKISVPFIYDKENAEKINEVARNNNITIVIKPHPAQDMSFIDISDLSNIILIDNDFLIKNGINNYELLGNSSALLSDYSSVFYDYLLCDKPIGFCWEDFDEYVKNEGINDELLPLTECGEKLYTVDDLCEFIKNTAEGKDTAKDKRVEIKNKVHKFCDSNSSQRIADRIIEKIKDVS